MSKPLKIPIIFTPRECIKYEQNFVLDINNLHQINVTIIGEGIPFKLELEKNEDNYIDLGVVRVGQEYHKYIPIVNQGKKMINITFDIDN